MKTLALNLTKKTVVIVLCFLLVGNSTVQAQSSIKNDEKVSIFYAGLENDHLVFFVNVTNQQNDKLQLQLTDEKKNVLFEEIFTKATLSKKFLVKRDDINNVLFQIRGRHYNFYREYSIVTKITEDVIVDEMK